MRLCSAPHHDMKKMMAHWIICGCSSYLTKECNRLDVSQQDNGAESVDDGRRSRMMNDGFA